MKDGEGKRFLFNGSMFWTHFTPAYQCNHEVLKPTLEGINIRIL